MYRASVSASIEESAASSSSRESERQESLTTQAIHSSCEALSTSSVDAITAVNNYVHAFNQTAADAAAKAAPAIDGLNHSADLVAGSVSDTLAPNLRDALNAWVDAARGLATAIAGNYGAGRDQRRDPQAERHEEHGAGSVRCRISTNSSQQNRRRSHRHRRR